MWTCTWYILLLRNETCFIYNE